jgi:hypothetical protein
MEEERIELSTAEPSRTPSRRLSFHYRAQRSLRLGGESFLRPCLVRSVPLPYYGAIRRAVAVIPESNMGRQLHGD